VLRREVPIFDRAYGDVHRSHPQGREKLKFNEALKRVLNELATDLIETVRQRAEASGLRSLEDVRCAKNRLAGFSEPLAAENARLKKFLFDHVYERPEITEDRDRSVRCLEQMFEFYAKVPGSMPSTHEQLTGDTPRPVVVCDYIAGMTDQFLLKQHRERFTPA